MGYNYGGENRLNGENKGDTLQNIGWKLSYSYPLNRASGFKISYLGTRTRESTGLDTDTLAVSLTFAW